jgi:hypothetical protein
MTGRTRSIEWKFDPNQPRDGWGRWVEVGSNASRGAVARPAPTKVAGGWEFGVLIAQFDQWGERRCVYRFKGGSQITVKWGNLPCSRRMEWSALSHGDLMNDN